MSNKKIIKRKRRQLEKSLLQKKKIALLNKLNVIGYAMHSKNPLSNFKKLK